MTPALFTGLHLINSAVGDVKKKKEVDCYNDVIHLVLSSKMQLAALPAVRSRARCTRQIVCDKGNLTLPSNI